MSYKQLTSRDVVEGGTGISSATAYGVIVAGTSSTGAFQVVSLGSSGDILVSNGSGAAPSFQTGPFSQMNFQVLSSDPSTPGNAQVWYRSDLGEFRGAIIGSGTWTTITSMSSGRRGAGAAGDASDAIVFGGFNGTIFSTINEKWNGASWSTVNSLNTGRNNVGACGDTSSALVFGGLNGGGQLNGTESWNGTSWSAGNNLNTSRSELGSAGIPSAALSFGGKTGSVSAVTESFNGTSWSSVNSLNTAREWIGGGGIQSDAVSFGGSTGSDSNVTETWNGTNWSTGNNLNSARSRLPSGKNGTSSSCLAAGGLQSPSTALTSCERFNGTNWSNITSLNSTSDNGSICGSPQSALTGGANATSAVAQTFTDLTIYSFDVT